MAGSFIKVELTNEKPLLNLLTSYIKQGQSLEPALAEIGEYLIESHQERFTLEVAPDGTPWEPLSPKTIKHKNGDDRILQASDTMRDQLAYQLGSNELEFGSNLTSKQKGESANIMLSASTSEPCSLPLMPIT